MLNFIKKGFIIQKNFLNKLFELNYPLAKIFGTDFSLQVNFYFYLKIKNFFVLFSKAFMELNYLMIKTIK